ncbi:MAG TPA: protein phosphatase CheZ, partial [Gammaproteobacteria bacterium]|nr:protein phosphatase CheZ [Gammaproteobacteria bacterium]
MDGNKLAGKECLAQARQLVADLEAGNEEAAGRALDDLTRARDASLFHELGKLTRELHEALNSFQLDARMANLTESDIPDARARLNHVITMTEQSAHRTLNAVEAALPVSEELRDEASALHGQWQRFRRRDMDVEEFRRLSQTLEEFLATTTDRATHINQNLSEVLMAQDFQDLTGQIIRKVIALVKEVEDNLVNLVRISGERIKCVEPEAAQVAQSGFGPAV